MFARFFIDRPIFAAVLSIIIVFPLLVVFNNIHVLFQTISVTILQINFPVWLLVENGYIQMVQQARHR